MKKNQKITNTLQCYFWESERNAKEIKTFKFHSMYSKMFTVAFLYWLKNGSKESLNVREWFEKLWHIYKRILC